MAKQTPMQRAARRPDPDGDRWFADARAVIARNEKTIERWRAEHGSLPSTRHEERAAHRELMDQLDDVPPLPVETWQPPRQARVSRPIMGRFLHDRDTDVVHDVTQATDDCQLDDIRNGTFVHFARELPDAVPDTAQPHSCMD